jgi:hypothetical protein
MAATKAPFVIRLMGHLTALAVLCGALSTLSYGGGAHVAVRFVGPGAGAWWNQSEFWIMEGSAAALGILIAIRIGARMIGDPALKARSAAAALLVAVAALNWITLMVAALARLGWSAPANAIGNRTAPMVGYGAGQFVDKLLIAGVYFLKSAGFALLFGLALFGAVLAILIASSGGTGTAEQPAAGF